MALPEMKYVTNKEQNISTVLMFTLYFIGVFLISSSNIPVYLTMCLVLIIALSQIRKHALFFLNERRSPAEEVKPEVSSDDDSNDVD
jgi:heme/copper-type cytochrome/quinol oxidase subunit 4